MTTRSFNRRGLAFLFALAVPMLVGGCVLWVEDVPTHRHRHHHDESKQTLDADGSPAADTTAPETCTGECSDPDA